MTQHRTNTSLEHRAVIPLQLDYARKDDIHI
ncbi:hypothetical protein AF72_00370 [Xylella taiwanensis]|uniref:Uncharacterized protein n=1 Tax=Xylella taiwanensis TaxID=1444770 RepID=Z9JMM4_9GAMM|nr:hypothetical protein AF72_00370 [Xylella taiwanensis]